MIPLYQRPPRAYLLTYASQSYLIDRKANIAAYGGRVGALRDQVTPAGIR